MSILQQHLKGKKKDTMNLINKKIGVWGFGISGKAMVNFLHKQNALIQVLDQKLLTPQDKTDLTSKNISFLSANNIEQFLQSNDFIIASPGIDLYPYKAIKHKLIAELDLFTEYFKKPIIAITGTVGKTTITKLLTKSLKEQNLNIAVGGNIGIGLGDLINNNAVDYAILEVSSFQLEYCKTFAPDLAIISNFHPNHLDRHITLINYWQAKLNIMRSQNKNQQLLLPLELANKLPGTITSSVSFFSPNKPTEKQKTQWHAHALFWLYNNQIIKSANGIETVIYTIDNANQIFTENIVCIIAALSLLKKPIGNLVVEPIEHRMEKIAIINGITFYNDSKSTVPEATLAAVNNFKKHSIHLFLGGLSKGIDRAPLVAALKNKVVFIYCFGAEAEQLANWCKQNAIPCDQFKMLDEAFARCIANILKNDIVLFSPSGASFDLFANYQKRGEYFKSLVKQLAI
jgi:UDP-N-acetylmuramoylalanine--D-glutamate ligase